MMQLTSTSLRKAAEIMEQIETLKLELSELLSTDLSGNGDSKGPSASARPIVEKSNPAGNLGDSLSDAAVAVVRQAGHPMKVRQIYDALVENGFQFKAANPKRSLSAAIYTIKGLKKVGPGTFAAR